jgi:hypothetical protein
VQVSPFFLIAFSFHPVVSAELALAAADEQSSSTRTAPCFGYSTSDAAIPPPLILLHAQNPNPDPVPFRQQHPTSPSTNPARSPRRRLPLAYLCPCVEPAIPVRSPNAEPCGLPALSEKQFLSRSLILGCSKVHSRQASWLPSRDPMLALHDGVLLTELGGIDRDLAFGAARSHCT